jgi:hypothetical protein
MASDEALLPVLGQALEDDNQDDNDETHHKQGTAEADTASEASREQLRKLEIVLQDILSGFSAGKPDSSCYRIVELWLAAPE